MLSVIIVTYNSKQTIGDCLRSIELSARQLPPGDKLEIICVDNASTDGSADIIASSFSTVRLIRNEENRGFAAAVNQAAKAAKCDALFILNPDTSLTENTLVEISRFLRERNDVSLFGCRLQDVDGKPQPSCYKTPSLWTLALEMFLPYSGSLRFVTNSPPSPVSQERGGEVDTVTGAAMVVRKNLFEKLGGFSEDFFLYYEDLDFCVRARAAGSAAYYIPSAVVMHRKGASSWQDMKMFFYYLYSSKLTYFRKHLSRLGYAFARILIYWGIILRIIAYSVVGTLTFNKHLLSLARDHWWVLGRLGSV
jgi:hypothetical protein